ncbi:hypothetical protein QBC44DRAFT_368655 [Cladorrhinum sp. PSN332]|nr:hypothetical protein QBC44DRAFT_368655 [Cladorrhinum sp. PSN332]
MEYFDDLQAWCSPTAEPDRAVSQPTDTKPPAMNLRDELEAASKSRVRELEGLEAQNEALLSECEELRHHLSLAQDEVSSAQFELLVANDDLTATSKTLASTERELAIIKANLSSAEEELFSRGEQLEKAETSVKKLEEHVVEKACSLTVMAENRDHVAHELQEATEALNGALVEKTYLKEALAETHARADAAIASRDKALQELSAARERAKEDLQGETRELSDRVTELYRESLTNHDCLVEVVDDRNMILDRLAAKSKQFDELSGELTQLKFKAQVHEKALHGKEAELKAALKDGAKLRDDGIVMVQSFQRIFEGQQKETANLTETYELQNKIWEAVTKDRERYFVKARDQALEDLQEMKKARDNAIMNLSRAVHANQDKYEIMTEDYDRLVEQYDSVLEKLKEMTNARNDAVERGKTQWNQFIQSAAVADGQHERETKQLRELVDSHSHDVEWLQGLLGETSVRAFIAEWTAIEGTMCANVANREVKAESDKLGVAHVVPWPVLGLRDDPDDELTTLDVNNIQRFLVLLGQQSSWLENEASRERFLGLWKHENLALAFHYKVLERYRDHFDMVRDVAGEWVHNCNLWDKEEEEKTEEANVNETRPEDDDDEDYDSCAGLEEELEKAYHEGRFYDHVKFYDGSRLIQMDDSDSDDMQH